MCRTPSRKNIGCRFCGQPSKRIGKTGSGKQRFKCLVCKRTFVWQKHKPDSSRADIVAFSELVRGEINRKKIGEESGLSRPTISIRFKLFFDHPIPSRSVWQILPPKPLSSSWVLGIDGKWLRRNGVLLIYRNITSGENLLWSFHPSESYVALYTDLEALTGLPGFCRPVGVVSDWKGSIVSGVAAYLGNIPHQRCLTHVQRIAERLLPRHSPFPATLTLRKIAQGLINVSNELEKYIWQMELADWQAHYAFMLTERTNNPVAKHRWWYTHGNVRRAWRLLTKDQEPFFVHLKQPLIPSSNNSLEGTISQMSNKLSDHRGMKTLQQVSFLFWYLTFTRTKSKPDLKKLWGWWKAEKMPSPDTRNFT